MENEHEAGHKVDRLMIYQIKLKGHLSDQWMNLFEGLSVTLQEDGNSLLTGPVTDQSALYGILRKVRDLGMPLLSVTFVDANPAGNQTARTAD